VAEVFFSLCNRQTVTADQDALQTIADARKSLYTIRPLVKWDRLGDQHRDGDRLVQAVVALVPYYKCWQQNGVMDDIRLVAKRPALETRIKAFLLTGGNCCITTEVS
jgi:hypothetical protein